MIQFISISITNKFEFAVISQHKGSWDYFTVSPPEVVVPIVAEINGPKLVGQCAVFTLTSTSIGVADETSSEWTLVSPLEDFEGDTYVWYGSALVMDVNQFGEYLGDIVVTLSVKNWMGTEDVATHVITRATIDAPVLSIAGNAIQIVDTAQV